MSKTFRIREQGNVAQKNVYYKKALSKDLK